MPVIFIIAFVVVIIKAAAGTKPKKRKVTVYSVPHMQPTMPVVYDPVKIAKEQERQLDRQRKEQERREKALDREIQLYEKELKKEAAAKANRDKAKQNSMLAEQYTKYIVSLKLELNDSDISLTRQNQVQKEILRAQEKVVKLMNEADKAQYQYAAYQTYINS